MCDSSDLTLCDKGRSVLTRRLLAVFSSWVKKKRKGGGGRGGSSRLRRRDCTSRRSPCFASSFLQLQGTADTDKLLSLLRARTFRQAPRMACQAPLSRAGPDAADDCETLKKIQSQPRHSQRPTRKPVALKRKSPERHREQIKEMGAFGRSEKSSTSPFNGIQRNRRRETSGGGVKGFEKRRLTAPRRGSLLFQRTLSVLPARNEFIHSLPAVNADGAAAYILGLRRAGRHAAASARL